MSRASPSARHRLPPPSPVNALQAELASAKQQIEDLKKQQEVKVKRRVWTALREESAAVAEKLRQTTNDLEIVRRAANAAKHNRTQRISDLEEDVQKRDSEIKEKSKLAARDAAIDKAKRSQQYAVNQSDTRLDGLQTAADAHAAALRQAADAQQQLTLELGKARAALETKTSELKALETKVSELVQENAACRSAAERKERHSGDALGKANKTIAGPES
eukprot:3147854-Pleurochrysis_carterae.AAC.2